MSIALNDDIERLKAFAGSVEERLFKHVQRIADAYLRLCNLGGAVPIEEAKESLKEMKLATRDFSNQILQILIAKDCRPEEIRDWTERTRPNIANLWNNALQMYTRFIYSEPAEKLLELTCLHYMAKDLADLIEATPVESFTKRIIRPLL